MRNLFKHISCFVLIAFTIGCSNSNIEKELVKVHKELEEAQKEIEVLKGRLEPEGSLVHIVLFKLKPDEDKSLFIAELKKVKEIKVVNDFECGLFENLGDERALSEFDIIMQMSFDNKSKYELYQKHPIHLALKESAKSFLAGPPATYDFIKE